MGTDRPGSHEEPGDRPSRFAYHGDSPEEGGVRSTGHRSGAPGPEELLLDISELARSVGMQYTHRFRIPPYPADDIDYAEPLDGEITLTNTGGVLLLRGHVATKLNLECGRCLEPLVEGVETELEEEFDLVTARNAYHQEEVQAVDEDSPASVIQGNVLNLGELLRQDLLLAAPLQPLCQEDCPGLDPATGRKRTGPVSEQEQEEVERDNPLRRLGEMLAAKRENEPSE